MPSVLSSASVTGNKVAGNIIITSSLLFSHFKFDFNKLVFPLSGRVCLGKSNLTILARELDDAADTYVDTYLVEDPTNSKPLESLSLVSSSPGSISTTVAQ